MAVTPGLGTSLAVELTMSRGPNQIDQTTRTFERVVGRHLLDVIWETIPKCGVRIQVAKGGILLLFPIVDQHSSPVLSSR